MLTVSRCGTMNSNTLKSLGALSPLSLPIRMMIQHSIGRVVGRVHEDSQESVYDKGGGGKSPVVREYRYVSFGTDAKNWKTL